MARANGVDAHVPHDLQLPLHGPGVEGAAERPVIVMQVYAIKLHPPAIQVKSVIRRKLERPDAEGRRIHVHNLAIHANCGFGRV